MWVNQEIDVPQDLITAQREGRLIIFAGAGVSMGPPSNLPNFEQLALAVAQGVATLKPGETFDAFLGRVEQQGVDVQTRTRVKIDVPDSTPKRVHQLIVNLFRDESSVRLVTTNFDRHFTTVAHAKYPAIEIFTGPALPLGRDFNGLVYLHGAVEKARSTLILNDGDFGRAYLADGWATRFLMEMFRTFAVLFIGYSHQDPVMRYLARSFVGGTARYSLTPAGHDDHWINLGITPVHFPLKHGTPNPYSAIDDGLDSWARTAAMGTFDHQTRVAQLTNGPPPVDPESLDYLRFVMSNPVTLRLFTDAAKDDEWLKWVEAEGFFAPLVSSAPVAGDGPRILAFWFADRFVVQHQKLALAFVQRHSASVSVCLSDAIAMHLAFRARDIAPDTLRLWTTALVAVGTTSRQALSDLLRKCSDTGNVAATAILFRFMLRPELRFERYWDRPDFGGRSRLDVEIALAGEEYDLRHVWEQLKPQMAGIYQQLLPMVTDYLGSGFDLLNTASEGESDWDSMSYRRAAIEPHAQDAASPDWGLLVDVARDVIEWAAEHDPAFARATIETWSVAPPQLLLRLAIHAIARRTDLAANHALRLIEERGWLYKTSLKHEVFKLLERFFSAADDDAQRRFLAHSLAARVLENADDPDGQRITDYERYNLAVWVAQVAPDSNVAREHLLDLQAQHADFGPRDHPDMDRWISTGWVGQRSPKTSQELLQMEVAEAVTYLLEYRPDNGHLDGPNWEGLLTVVKQAASGDIEWSLRVADEMVVRGVWTAELWNHLLSVWRSPEITDVAWTRILDLLEHHVEIGDNATWATANFVEEAITRKDIGISDVERLERIGERLLAPADAIQPGVRRGDGSIDWFTSTLNHPAGQVALMWIKALSRRISIDRDSWQGLPEQLRARFDALLGGRGHSAELAIAAFASQLHFLFRVDRPWTEASVIPVFNWEADAAKAAHAWEGFLTWGRWNDALLERMQVPLRQTFQRIASLGDKQEAFTSSLASIAAFSPADPWHANGWLFEFLQTAAAEHRAHWAGQLGHYLTSVTPAGIDALWDRWLREYWADRITGVPRPLEDAERQAMLRWLPSLHSQFAAAIDLILQAPPTTLDHFAFYRLREANVSTTHGRETGRLLRGVFPTLQTVWHDHGEVFELAAEALDHDADPNDLVVVAEHMARLNIQGAVELRARAIARRA